MTITYINHSGFFVELDTVCLLFDYWQGALPAPDAALVAQLEVMSQRPAHHQHDMHLMRIQQLTVRKGDVVTVHMSVNGGFAMVVEK